MINIISSCTNSKKYHSDKTLKIENFDGSLNLDNAIKKWITNINNNSAQKYLAKNLYKGGAWKASVDTHKVISQKFDSTLYIASAGYGLIQADQMISSYDTTFASSTVNSITKFDKNGSKMANVHWWNNINTFSLSSFSKSSSFFIVLPHDYLFAAQDTIKELIQHFGNSVFIFTANKHQVPDFMKENLIQFDSRFNNFQSGVLSNMLQRAVLWLANEIVNKNLPLSHIHLQNHIEQEMQKHEVFIMPVRKKLTEEEIKKTIKEMIVHENIPSASKGLKAFRSNGYACEQKRFGQLFKEVKGSLS